MCKRVFVLNKGNQIYDGDFNTLIKKLVAIAVASVLTKLLPNRSVPINFSFLFFKKLTILALIFFSFSNWYIVALDAAVKAVSEPEKNADITSKKIMARINSIV